MWNFDAHVHSNASDGTDTPVELVALAADAGLTGFALTDHDLFANLGPVRQAADAADITVVRGIELSTVFEGRSAHLLAYEPEPDDSALTRVLQKIREHRRTRVRKIIDRIARDHPQVTWERFVEHQSAVGETGAAGRPHVADLLVSLGIVPDRDAAFAHILSHRGPYYEPHWAPDPREMVEIVLAAGGVPVLAHPLSRERQRPLPKDVLVELAQIGLFGLERDHREHSDSARDQVDQLADKLGLVTTGGSDYHGSGKPNLLGENTTDRATMELILARARAEN